MLLDRFPYFIRSPSPSPSLSFSLRLSVPFTLSIHSIVVASYFYSVFQRMLHLCLFFVLSIIVISFYFLSPTPTAIHIFSPDSIVGLGTERTENKI